MENVSKKARRAFSAAFLLAQSGCSLEPPEPAVRMLPDHQDYIGVWEQRAGSAQNKQYKRVFAQISADGRISYQRINVHGSGHSCSSYNAATIQRMDVGEIEATVILWFTIKFKIDVPPRKSDGVWTMTLDGDRLTRTQPEPIANLGKLDCDEVKNEGKGGNAGTKSA